MSDGDEEPEQAGDESAADAAELDVDTLESRLDDAADALEAAETESDLDTVEDQLDAVESDIEAADLPEPEEGEDDEEAESPTEALEARLSDLRDDLDEQRGPYATDAVRTVDQQQAAIEDTRWTEQGVGELAESVGVFLDATGDILGTEFGGTEQDTEVLSDLLGEASDAIEDAGLDADDDSETIADLIEAADDLAAGVENSQSWDDLSVREKLRAEGFYEPIEGNKAKDYPPELSAIKGWTKRDNAEMVLLALEKLGDSQQMERMCLDALKKMGNEDALDTLTQRAARRDIPAIEAIGAIGSEDGVEAIIDYTESDTNPKLQKTAIHALGQIGSEETTQAIADQLEAENEGVRSQAARSLGLIGDTRAVKPLTESLAQDESDSVRASAAWALVQIGTQDALEAAAEHADDRSFIVQEEAQKAADALDAEEAPAA